MKSGIYRIRNLENGKTYIGSAVNLKRRWTLHQYELGKGRHRNTHLQNSWDKYGKDAFVFEVLEEVEADKLVEREQFYLTQLFETNEYYNILPVAYSHLGAKRSEETRAKISESNRRRIITDEHRAKQSEAIKGRKLTEEHKLKVKLTSTGRKYPNRKPQTDEHRAKNSAGNKGKKHSPEWTEKIKASLTGRKRTEEQRERMRLAWVKRKEQQKAQ